MNRLELGTRVYSIHHSDGTKNPTHYWLQLEGIVSRISQTGGMKVIRWGKAPQFDSTEKMFLAPNRDGFCYYMAELPNMNQYKDGDLYKVPTKVLKPHMKSYRSPW